MLIELVAYLLIVQGGSKRTVNYYFTPDGESKVLTGNHGEKLTVYVNPSDKYKARKRDPIAKSRILSQVDYDKMLKKEQDDAIFLEKTDHYKLQPTVDGLWAEAPGPPEANYCPKCGKGPYLNECECGYKTVIRPWEKDQKFWEDKLKFCPFCKAPIKFNNGCAECTKCQFQSVVDEKLYDPAKNDRVRAIFAKK